jgi:hypothetical protein
VREEGEGMFFQVSSRAVDDTPFFKYRILKGTILAKFIVKNKVQINTQFFQPLHRPFGDGARKERRIGDGARKWRRVRNFFKYRLLKGTMLA